MFVYQGLSYLDMTVLYESYIFAGRNKSMYSLTNDKA